MKKLASLGRGAGGGVAGLALVAVLASGGHAADRADSPALAANPMADITDVYAWMTGTNLNLVMDVSPRDNGSHSFDPGVVYVFHVTSKPRLGIAMPDGPETRVICQFASNVGVQCWVVSGATTRDYVTGDPSNTAGVTSILGKVKVFAGRRSDPAFGKQSGFTTAMADLANLRNTGLDGAGCPAGISPTEADRIRRTELMSGSDDFLGSDVMALVVQVDKSLVNSAGNTVVAVWGSTHAGA